MANLLTGQTKEGGQKIIRKSETGSTEQTRRSFCKESSRSSSSLGKAEHF